MPLFTIAIVTRNYGHFIEQAIRSCLCAGDPDIDVLVVDDGSEDDTRLIVASIQQAHPNGGRIRYHPCGRIGLAAARNEALRLAKGTFLVCLDADDVLMPATLGLYRQAIHDYPEIDVLYGYVVATFVDLVPAFRLPTRDVPPYPHSIEPLLARNFIPHPGTACRVESMRQIGGYRVGLDRGEDYAMWLDLAIHGARFQYLDACVCLYRQHDDNLSRDYRIEWHRAVLQAMLARYALHELMPSLDWRMNEASAHWRALRTMVRHLRRARADKACVRASVSRHLQPAIALDR
ncbi:glycosyl transferase family 2 [Burkholderia ambifaria IOP40-10]|uniref:Glycosyl transferase family 2 n=1 Tax=Burkholderia ambifaria IOP40-10 TaxID=396596 RepID=B1FBA6_9BURK|nr:glycosyltransferase [Burkholderia ambifaria]EDT05188.1 glycosyl transferase family 2 [Burkholderia ambifaria IOP40-10]